MLSETQTSAIIKFNVAAADVDTLESLLHSYYRQPASQGGYRSGKTCFFSRSAPMVPASSVGADSSRLMNAWNPRAATSTCYHANTGQPEVCCYSNRRNKLAAAGLTCHPCNTPRLCLVWSILWKSSLYNCIYAVFMLGVNRGAEVICIEIKVV